MRSHLSAGAQRLLLCLHRSALPAGRIPLHLGPLSQLCGMGRAEVLVALDELLLRGLCRAAPEGGVYLTRRGTVVVSGLATPAPGEAESAAFRH